MKRMIGFMFLACFSLEAMESKQNESEASEKRIVNAMLGDARTSYEQAFRIIDTMDPEKLSHETMSVLKKMATQPGYKHLLEYAFDAKKILPTDELASSLLVEAADNECIVKSMDDLPIKNLLRRGIDPNRPGKFLFHEAIGRRGKLYYTPLVVAVIKGWHLNVKALFEKGADANGHQPHENLPQVEAFMRYHNWFRKPQPSFENPTGLLYCSYQNIEYQLKHKGADERQDNGKDISLKDFEGRAPCRTVWEMKGRLGYNGI